MGARGRRIVAVVHRRSGTHMVTAQFRHCNNVTQSRLASAHQPGEIRLIDPTGSPGHYNPNGYTGHHNGGNCFPIHKTAFFNRLWIRRLFVDFAFRHCTPD